MSYKNLPQQIFPSARLASLPRQNQGMILATILIFLAILTLLAVTSLQSTILQERLSANVRDRSVAFQAAEAALRAGEIFIENNIRVAADLNLVAPVDGGVNLLPAAFSGGAANSGFAYRAMPTDQTGTPVVPSLALTLPLEPDFFATNWNDTDSVAVTDAGLVNALTQAGVTLMPRFMIAYVGAFTTILGQDGAVRSYQIKGNYGQASTVNFAVFRITARAQGLTPNSFVYLQSYYAQALPGLLVP